MNGKYTDNIDNFIGQAVYIDVNHSGFTSLQAAADAAIETFGDDATLILGPGEYNSDITVSSPLVIKELVPGTVRINGALSGVIMQTLNITGNTLAVSSVGGAVDRFATAQEAYDAVAVDNLLGVPAYDNPVWVAYKGINFAQSRVAVVSVADVNGTDCLIITSAAHGLTAGDYVRLVGMSVVDYDSEFRTAYEVKTAPTDTTFTIEMAYSATATGIAIKQGVLVTSNEYVGVEADNKTVNLVVE